MGNTSGRKGGGRTNPLEVALRRGNIAEIQRLLTEQKLRRELARENGTAPKGSHEFGGSASAAKVLKAAISGGMSEFCDKGLSVRLTSLHLRMVNYGDGEKGMRALRVQENKEHYEGVCLAKQVRFEMHYNAIPVVEVEACRSKVMVRFPASDADHVLLRRGRASRFQLVMVAGVMSDFCWNVECERYEAVHSKLAGMSVVVRSGLLRTDGKLPELELEAELPGVPMLPDGAVLLVGLGIEYYVEVNGEWCPTSRGVMQVRGAY